MNTPQIAPSALEGYKNAQLSDERIAFLREQASSQLEEIGENQPLYEDFLKQVNAPKEVDEIILWILLMSNEDIVDGYIDAFDKPFNDVIPVSDLADLLFFSVYLHKIQNTTLKGYDYLMEYEGEGIEDVDQYSLTNTFLYIQKLKEPTIEF